MKEFYKITLITDERDDQTLNSTFMISADHIKKVEYVLRDYDVKYEKSEPIEDDKRPRDKGLKQMVTYLDEQSKHFIKRQWWKGTQIERLYNEKRNAKAALFGKRQASQAFHILDACHPQTQRQANKKYNRITIEDEKGYKTRLKVPKSASRELLCLRLGNEEKFTQVSLAEIDLEEYLDTQNGSEIVSNNYDDKSYIDLE